MKISKCVGIDLGTTNSVIAMMGEDNKTPLCRTDKTGRKTFPSVVVYDGKSNSLKAGQIAFNRRGTLPEPVVSIKSHMGDSNYSVNCGPLALSPVEVSAEILKAMREQMQAYLSGIPEYADYVVDRAVITIPAYFASNAREATTRAGELAGFKVEFTLQEPTASALYYCFKNGIDNGVFMVYDLGGGTFDVSIVRLNEGDAYVLGIAGNNYLGGDNFDDALAHHLLELLQDPDEGYDLELDINRNEEDRLRFTRLKLEAEIIKKALSSKDEHYEMADGIFKDKSGATVNLAATVTRAEFEALISPLLQTTIDECYTALKEAEEKYSTTLDMIDGVLLVGGSTHIPLVARMIEKTFTDPSLPIHTKLPRPLCDEPDMAVGYGAAIAAASCGTVSAGAESVAHGGKTLLVSAAFKPGRGYGGISMVEGRLTAELGELPQGIYAQVERAAGGCAREYMVDEDGSFVFEELTAEQDKEPYACRFVADGKVILSTSFDGAVLSVGEMPVVLSRNYYIETMNENTGKTQLIKLMEKGTQLPCSRDYSFSVNSKNPYFAELRFFEEREFLKQVGMTFDPPVPPGTVINLSLACDISSRFTARAEAAGIVVDVVFEQSPPPKIPEPDEIDRVVRAVRERIALIPEAGKRLVAEKMLTRLAREAEQAAEEGDACKALDKLNALRNILSDTPSSAPMEPPRQSFDALVAECRKLNETSDSGSSEVARDISDAAALGYRAYDSDDQPMLSKAVNDLGSIKELLTDKAEDDGKRPPMWMLCHVFAKQALDLIDTVEESDKMPPALKEKLLASADADRRDLRKIIDAVRFMPTDEQCQPYLEVIRRVYPQWEKAAEILNFTLPTV
ncbi:MAG: Hsp70 family protein [Oscillospiraceae bacterium]|nr:Hsp70 family protein [Oscillospiraceae bacterium]